MSVVISYTDDQSESNTITLTAASDVDNVNDSPTGSVTISGTATEDQVLTAANTLADEDGLGRPGDDGGIECLILIVDHRAVIFLEDLGMGKF